MRVLELFSEMRFFLINEKIEIAEAEILPTPEELCLQIPLYKKLKLSDQDSDWLVQLEDYRGALDIYCHECKRYTVFKGSEFPGIRMNRKNRTRSTRDDRNFTLEFFCPRNADHNAIFLFRIFKGVLEKIGQSPSIAEIAAPDLQVYRSILGDERLSEFSRGIGLAAHGVGAGSLLYMRRIFESIIEEIKSQATEGGKWRGDAETNHMDKKILSLKEYLPEFLVENRKAYGIMSHGLHALTDNECLSIFPLIKTSIELILDGIIEKRTKEKKINKVRNDMAKLDNMLKAKNEATK